MPFSWGRYGLSCYVDETEKTSQESCGGKCDFSHFQKLYICHLSISHLSEYDQNLQEKLLNGLICGQPNASLKKTAAQLTFYFYFVLSPTR